MDASFIGFKIRWKLVSTVTEADRVTYEYECPLPGKYSDRKYHMTKAVTTHGVFIRGDII